VVGVEGRWRSAKQRDFILPATNGASAGDREKTVLNEVHTHNNKTARPMKFIASSTPQNFAPAHRMRSRPLNSHLTSLHSPTPTPMRNMYRAIQSIITSLRGFLNCKSGCSILLSPGNLEVSNYTSSQWIPSLNLRTEK
jgi:hypothetical protein